MNKISSPRSLNATSKMWCFLPLCCKAICLRKHRGRKCYPRRVSHGFLTPSHCVDFPYLVSLAGAEKITLRHAPRGVVVTFCSSVCRRHIGELSPMVTEGLKIIGVMLLLCLHEGQKDAGYSTIIPPPRRVSPR